jgi:hypothetical protein
MAPILLQIMQKLLTNVACFKLIYWTKRQGCKWRWCYSNLTVSRATIFILLTVENQKWQSLTALRSNQVSWKRSFSSSY